MITKDWLQNKRNTQKILEKIKFTDLSSLDSKALFARFLVIWDFGYMINGLSKQEDVSDTIKLRLILLAKFKKLELTK